MIVGIGVDVIEIKRIEDLINNYPDHAIFKIFTKNEIYYCETQKFKYNSYSARFAAKEAMMKALGRGLRNGINWKDIEIVHSAYGKPMINLYGKALELAQNLNAQSVEVSLSHSKTMAIAMVVLST